MPAATATERLLYQRCCSIWAERFRWIQDKNTRQWGPWSFDGYEPLRGIHDCFDPRCVVMKGSQMGVTEVIVNREMHVLWLGMNSMHLLPAADEATDFSDGRFKLAIENSPMLADLFERTDNKSHKVTKQGANAYFRGGNSRSKAKSSPSNLVGIDEFEEINAVIIALIRDRMDGQPDGMKWEVCISTPIHPNKGIHLEYQRGDQRDYFMPCPCCGERTTFAWWTGQGEDRKPNLWREGSHVTIGCSVSGCRISEEHHPLMRKRGDWMATVEGLYPSFFLTGLLSPTRSWSDVLQEYENACENPDPKVLREVINGKIGLPFVEKGMAVSRELLVQRSKESGHVTGAQPAPYISAGVDAGVRGHYLTILSNEDGKEKVQRAVMCRDFGEIEAWVHMHAVHAIVIDAQPNTESSRELQKRLADKGVTCLLAYYSMNMKARIKWDWEAVDGAQVVAHRTESLSESMGRLMSGDTAYPTDAPAEALDHCAAMRKVVEPDAAGNLRAVWDADGPDHFAHSLNYARMALEVSGKSNEDWGNDELDKTDWDDDAEGW